MKLFNAFSLQMIDIDIMANVQFEAINKEKAARLLSNSVDSYIGHADTAAVVSNILGIQVECNRRFGHIDKGETAIVAQVVGGRLPEGCTKLPENMKIKFYKVEVK